MKRVHFLPYRSLLGVLLFAVMLAGCSSAQSSLWLKAPGWSRGAYQGATFLAEAVPLVLDHNGNVYLLRISRVGDNFYPLASAFDRSANQLWEKQLEQPYRNITGPQLFWDGKGLQLYWVGDATLYRARMDAEGNLQEEPVALSGDVTVDNFAVAQLAGGEAAVWFSSPRREPGLYRLPAGQEGAAPVLVDPQGIRPALRVSADNTLHVVWAHFPLGYGTNRYFYNSFPDGSETMAQPVLLYETAANPTSLVEGPWLGIEDQQVYVIWSISFRTGGQAGTTITSYVHFPPGAPPESLQAEDFRIPEEYRLEYENVKGGSLKAGARVPLPGSYAQSSEVTKLSSNAGQESELVLAFHTQAQYLWRQVKGQVSTAFLNDGELSDYQLLSFTTGESTSPAILSDDQGYLYLTWIEKGGEEGHSVYFATTAPDLRTVMNQLSADDLGRLAAETVFGMLIGAVLSPLAGFIWVFGALAALVVTAPLRRGRNKNLVKIGMIVSILLALGVYWAVKIGSLPEVYTYVPFSAWIPMIPAWLALPLMLATPTLILAIALLVAWHFTFRRESESVLNFVFIYAGVDAVLTMAIYGVLIYSAF